MSALILPLILRYQLLNLKSKPLKMLEENEYTIQKQTERSPKTYGKVAVGQRAEDIKERTEGYDINIVDAEEYENSMRSNEHYERDYNKLTYTSPKTSGTLQHVLMPLSDISNA